MNVTIKWSPLECDYVLSVIECQILYSNTFLVECQKGYLHYSLHTYSSSLSFTVGIGKSKSTKLERNPDSATCDNRGTSTHRNISGKWMLNSLCSRYHKTKKIKGQTKRLNSGGKIARDRNF